MENLELLFFKIVISTLNGDSFMKLTTTQIGAIAENIVANEIMRWSGGRISPFQPVADDDGIDLLAYDKRSGAAIPLQIKSRTKLIKKTSTVHFDVRKATIRTHKNTCVIAALLDEDLHMIQQAWLIPMRTLCRIANKKRDVFSISPSISDTTRDKYKPYQCGTMKELTARLMKRFL